MTETEKAHLDNIRKLWIEDDSEPNWSVENDKYRSKIRDGKVLWFEYKVGNGWKFVKIKEE